MGSDTIVTLGAVSLLILWLGFMWAVFGRLVLRGWRGMTPSRRKDAIIGICSIVALLEVGLFTGFLPEDRVITCIVVGCVLLISFIEIRDALRKRKQRQQQEPITVQCTVIKPKQRKVTKTTDIIRLLRAVDSPSVTHASPDFREKVLARKRIP